ncbi:hypothetical protein NOR51B_1705 [Luminiphilus syltensis NOR5-1B]|uniref:Uncharacterized protein n=1 Tax=Luminiphilus syltensis NOR5-1B TaxID=565045 RepID=B8KWD1_9GAMM|nr:hypothetical protein [Luminiphilus syltensis]EED35758.1 hypothetical protein NOR51B_1705 [Luminiphilus syltensis NOR5-1B]
MGLARVSDPDRLIKSRLLFLLSSAGELGDLGALPQLRLKPETPAELRDKNWPAIQEMTEALGG